MTLQEKFDIAMMGIAIVAIVGLIVYFILQELKMGRHTYSDVVPFVAHGIWEASDNNILDGGQIFDPVNYSYFEAENPNPAFPMQLEIAGWKYYTADEIEGWNGYPNLTGCKMIGNRGRIYSSSLWAKGDKEVHLLNEHEYENVGEYFMSLISESKEAIEEFYNDVVKSTLPNITLPQIDETDTVQQTLQRTEMKGMFTMKEAFNSTYDYESTADIIRDIEDALMELGEFNGAIKVKIVHYEPVKDPQED